MATAERRNFWLIGILISILLPACSAAFVLARGKQEKGKEPKSQTIFRVPVNIVVVNATVTDKDGNPVTDLTAKDFKVFDDGKLQEIQTFALESYGPAELPETTASDPSKKRTAAEVKTERPRIISIVIDDLTMESAVNFPRMIEAVRDYIEKDMGSRDQVAILSGSGKVQVPFSDNKQRLLDELAVIFKKLNLSPAMRSDCPKLTDLEAYRLSDAMQENRVDRDRLINATAACLLLPGNSKQSAAVYLRAAATHHNQIVEFQTRNLLYTLRQHIRTLRHFEGAKTVAFFSDGFLAESETPAAYQLQEIVDLALRSGVVLNSVSIQNMLQADDVVLGGGSGDYAVQENKSARESPLSQIAYETGGMFSHSRNNLYKGIHEIAQRQSYYYILSYALPARKPDGAYHKIRLELTRPGLKLAYRKGYYVQKEEVRFENGKKEDIVDALNAPGDISEIPMTLAYNYSQEDDYTYSVSFITKANIRGMEFLEEDSRRKNLVSFILAAFDENDIYISGIDKSIEFRLLEDSYKNLIGRGLASRVELKLPAGRFKIKAVVREANQGKMGSITKSVEIP